MCRRKTPLQCSGIVAHRAPAGTSFNLKTWKGEGGDDYVLSMKDGEVKADGSAHGIY